jgi:hypothetical protein
MRVTSGFVEWMSRYKSVGLGSALYAGTTLFYLTKGQSSHWWEDFLVSCFYLFSFSWSLFIDIDF